MTEVELKLAVLTAHSNIPLAFLDKLSPAIHDLFPDSEIASQVPICFHQSHLYAIWGIAPLLISDVLSSAKTFILSLY